MEYYKYIYIYINIYENIIICVCIMCERDWERFPMKRNAENQSGGMMPIGSKAECLGQVLQLFTNHGLL